MSKTSSLYNLLVANRGKVVTYRAIAADLFGDEPMPTWVSNLVVYSSSLRKNNIPVITVRGEGLMLPESFDPSKVTPMRTALKPGRPAVLSVTLQNYLSSHPRASGRDIAAAIDRPAASVSSLLGFIRRSGAEIRKEFDNNRFVYTLVKRADNLKPATLVPAPKVFAPAPAVAHSAKPQQEVSSASVKPKTTIPLCGQFNRDRAAAQRAKVLEFIQKNPGCNSHDIVAALGISNRAADRSFARLREEGHDITCVGSVVTKSWKYYASKAIADLHTKPVQKNPVVTPAPKPEPVVQAVSTPAPVKRVDKYEVLHFIETHAGCTLRDICEALGKTSNAITGHISLLRQEGKIIKGQYENGTYRYTAIGSSKPTTVGAPIAAPVTPEPLEFVLDETLDVQEECPVETGISEPFVPENSVKRTEIIDYMKGKGFLYLRDITSHFNANGKQLTTGAVIQHFARSKELGLTIDKVRVGGNKLYRLALHRNLRGGIQQWVTALRCYGKGKFQEAKEFYFQSKRVSCCKIYARSESFSNSCR